MKIEKATIQRKNRKNRKVYLNTHNLFILISRDIYHTARYSIRPSSFQHICKAYLISSHLTNSLPRPNKQPKTRLASLPQETKEDPACKRMGLHLPYCAIFNTPFLFPIYTQTLSYFISSYQLSSST